MTSYLYLQAKGKNIYELGKASNIDAINNKLILWCEYRNEDVIHTIFETFRKKYIAKAKNTFEGNVNDMKIDIYDLLIIDASKDKNKGVVIANYGQETTDYITNAYVRSIIASGEAIQKYILYKHFNPEHPENHNIRLIRKNYYIKMNDRWQIFTINQLVDKLYTDALREIMGKNELVFSLYTNYSQNKKNIMSDTKDLIKLHLYNESSV